MEFINHWAILAVAVFAYFATLVFYRLFLDPLARFPGPKLAAISRWYEAYYDVVLGGKYTFKIAQLHKEYGGFKLSHVMDNTILICDRSHHPHQPVRATCIRSSLLRHDLSHDWALGQIFLGC